MSTAALREAATGKTENPVASFTNFLDRFKPQLALALPKHLNPDRMSRLAVTAFSTTPKLQECEPKSIVASIMTAGQMGLEIGVNGQGFLVPYGKTCTFVPGWKGLVDLVSRSGRATVWTGAVFQGDHFDYALGDAPFVKHKPGDEDDPEKLTHVYAVGRVNGSEWPVIEVWPMSKIWKHRNKYNKVGDRHYSFRDKEMYARKVPLLQVLKYMPASVELSNAIAVASAADMGQNATMSGDYVTVTDIDNETGEIVGKPTDPPPAAAAAKTAAKPSNTKPKPEVKPDPNAEPVRTFAQISDAIQKAKTGDDAALELDTARHLPDDQRAELSALFNRKWGAK